jgi:hypothetical protein
MSRCAVPAIALVTCSVCSCSLALEGEYTVADVPDAGPPTTYAVDAALDVGPPPPPPIPDAAPDVVADAATADTAPPFTCPPGAQHEQEPNDSTEDANPLKPGVFCGEVSGDDQDSLKLMVPQNSRFELHIEASTQVLEVMVGSSTATSNGTTVIGGNNDLGLETILQLATADSGPFSYRVTLIVK